MEIKSIPLPAVVCVTKNKTNKRRR